MEREKEGGRMPFVAIGNDELIDRPRYAVGDRVRRQSDGKVFQLEFATDIRTGNATMKLAFIKDGEDAFMVGVGGTLLSGWEIEHD